MSQQNPTIPTATALKNIDATIVDLQTFLSFELSWLSNGMGRAYKIKKTRSNGSVQFLPMVYLGTSKHNYFPATPDNDKEGQSIILVGDGTYPNYQQGFYGILEYPVSLIFSANLDTINSTLLTTELFTEHLMENVRQALIRDTLGKAYQIVIDSETIDFDSVYSEFDINTDAGKTNKPLAPMTYFRFDLTIQIKEACPSGTLDRCTAIQQNLTADDITNCIIPNYCTTYVNDYSIKFDSINERISFGIDPALIFDASDSISFCNRILWGTGITFPILSNFSTGTKGFSFQVYTNGKLRVLVFTDVGNRFLVESTVALLDSVSTHVAMTYDGTGATGVKFFINGLEVPTFIFLNVGTATTWDTGVPTYCGYVGSFNTYGKGTMNVLRGWRETLTPAMVLDDENGGVPKAAEQTGTQFIGNKMGDGAVFSGTNWYLPDTTGTINSSVSDNMDLTNRVAAI